MLSLSDFRLARSRSLSVSAWLPSAAPDLAEGEATAPPIPIWCDRVVAGAAELWGRLRRRRACNTAVRGLRRAFSLGFQAGAIAVFIR